jgi:hypothetical protein
MTYSYNKNKILPSTNPLILELSALSAVSLQTGQTNTQPIQLSNNFNGMISRITNAKIGCSSCGR